MTIEWLHGPHGFFILTSYGLSVIIALYCALAPVFKRRTLVQNMRVQQRSEVLAGKRKSEHRNNG